MADPKQLSIHRIKGYGWIPDTPDQRDYLYAAPIPYQQRLPASVDLSPQCPPVYDQGQLGSCTANAIAGAIEYDQRQRFVPSRLFIYYNERVMEGTVATDSGAQLRDGIKSVATLGAPPEHDWPYDIAKFADKPPALAYTAGRADLVTVYQRLLQNLNTMQACLAAGYPFIFGFTVYESFESTQVAQTGIVPLPQLGEQVLGGHAVMSVGYDNGAQEFLFRNSWGPDWGRNGYGKMPYVYLTSTQLAADFWTIRGVEEGATLRRP